MKFLIVTDAWHPQVNGVVRTYEHIIRELHARGHDTKVIGPSDFPHTMPLPGYSEISLTLFPASRLARMIEEYKPDHIHAAVEAPLGWAARKYCMRRGIAFSTSYHTQFPDYVAKRAAKYLPFLYKPVHAAARAYVRKFHAPSKGIMVATPSLEKTLKAWGFKNDMNRLTRGVDEEIFHPGASTLFKDLKKPIALYVGRVAIEKNIEAFLNMPWEGSKVVVGDGPSKKALEQKYPDVYFAGLQKGKDLADHYRSSDVFVFPSRTDTFGIVLIEALACGLPVAGYNVTGPKDIITVAGTGALHEHDLSAAAHEAIKTGKPDICTSHVKDNFTWQKATDQFIKST